MILPKIVVDVTPEQFQFRLKDRQHSLKTMVGVMIEDDIPKIVSIGKKADIPDALLVHLFDLNDTNPIHAGLDKFELFTAFMEYGVGKTLDSVRRPILQHSIIYRGAETLRPFFRGYQNFFLEAAALAGGARDVKFE